MVLIGRSCFLQCLGRRTFPRGREEGSGNRSTRGLYRWALLLWAGAAAEAVWPGRCFQNTVPTRGWRLLLPPSCPHLAQASPAGHVPRHLPQGVIRPLLLPHRLLLGYNKMVALRPLCQP